MEQKQLPARSLNTFSKILETNLGIAPEPTQTDEERKTWNSITIDLAARDVRKVLEQQRQQSKTLTTKLNMLFVVNGALLTSLTLSRLMFLPSLFSCAEVIAFLVDFTLLINAFLPRQAAVSPNLEDTKFLDRYLTLSPEDYQLRMMVNLVQTYNTNRQRIEDVSQSLTYAAYVTWTTALIIMLHVVAAYFLPLNSIQKLWLFLGS